ncbi:MAG TPA: hypothetical protein VE007_07045, partial [Thermoanaerobaculia bacterium]|nr:hypothetical protein [Thermoanaerobaculia bacterium]
MPGPLLPLLRLCVLLGTLLTIAGSCRAADFFVSPTGTATGDGSIGNPWDLQTALSGPASVHPGDTIWLRGGTYRGTFASNLNGTSSAPIRVRQYAGERATLDGGNSNRVNILTVSGSYTWYWGFEIMSSDPSRVSAQTGSDPTDVGRGDGITIAQTSSTGAGLKFINLVVHDTAGGFGLWKEAIGAEVYGCLVYYNGWTGPDRGHGHGIYAQNSNGVMRVADNIVFSNFSHGLQAFGSAAASLDNLTIQGNTFFDNGMPTDYQRNVLVGGGSIALNPRIVDNVLYYPGTAGQNLNVGYEPYGVGAANPVITGNYVVNGDNQFSPLNTNVTMTGNSFYSVVPDGIKTSYPANAYVTGSNPSTARVFVRPNQYEPGRANITVINWSKAATVPVDLSSILAPGATFEIRNAQSFFAPPVVKGTYDGSPVALRMAGMPTALLTGFSTPPTTGPDFNAFILLSDGGSA